MNKRKSAGKKLDTAIIVAIIALVGTLATAILSNPVLIAIISKTPSPTLSNKTITLTATPAITLSNINDWNLVLYDTFDQEGSSWNFGSADTDYFTMDRYIENGKYIWNMQLKDRSYGSGTAPNLALLSDFYVSVEIKQLDGVTNASGGIVFRKDVKDNYYSFEINSKQYYAIYVKYDDKSVKLVDWTKTTSIHPFNVNQLSIIAQGSHFYMFINNQYVGDFTDDTLSKGKVGLLASLYHPNDNAVFEFDNFDVRIP
jgi:hypothetical protein